MRLFIVRSQNRLITGLRLNWDFALSGPHRDPQSGNHLRKGQFRFRSKPFFLARFPQGKPPTCPGVDERGNIGPA